MNKKIAIGALIVVAIVVGGYAVSKNKVEKVSETNQGNIPSETSVKSSTYLSDPKNPGAYIYTSDVLGIRFQTEGKGKVVEEGNTITVNNQSTIEIFTKDPNLSFQDGVTKALFNSDTSDCSLHFSDNSASLFKYQIGSLMTKLPPQSITEMNQMGGDCPEGYGAINAVRYLIYDQKHPDKFAFVNDGQAVAISAPSRFKPSVGSVYNFDYTLEFIDR